MYTTLLKQLIKTLNVDGDWICKCLVYNFNIFAWRKYLFIVFVSLNRIRNISIKFGRPADFIQL